MSIEDLKIEYQDELTAIKSILEISDTSKDVSVILAIDKAYKSIMRYTGWILFNAEYVSALYSLAIVYYNNDTVNTRTAKGERIMTQKTQASRSATYINPSINIDSDGLTNDVRAMLPFPALKVL